MRRSQGGIYRLAADGTGDTIKLAIDVGEEGDHDILFLSMAWSDYVRRLMGSKRAALLHATQRLHQREQEAATLRERVLRSKQRLEIEKRKRKKLARQVARLNQRRRPSGPSL